MPFTNPHPLYQTWGNMRQRCNNPDHPQYNRYGGRGITIDPVWDDFAKFAEDMGPRPEGTSIDRIDVNRGYSPDNCRWATRKTQARNMTNNRYVVIAGVEYLAVELAEIAGIKTDTIITRVAAGLSYDEVVQSGRRYSEGGIRQAIAARSLKQRNLTHCAHGHEFTPENTRKTKEGWLRCRECLRIKGRKDNAARRARATS